MKRDALLAAVRPIAVRFAEELVAVMARELVRVRGAALELAADHVRNELGQGSPVPAATAEVDPAPPPSAKPPPVRRDAKAARATVPIPPPAGVAPRKRALMRCSKCGTEGKRADGCGRTHSVPSTPAPAEDSSDEEGPGAPEPEQPRRPRRASTAVTPTQEPPVISHASLVAMLAADRAHNAVGGAGGFVPKLELEPRIVGHTEERREFCRTHGWIGRLAFERDRHDLCAPVGEPCRACGGAKVVTAGFCDPCDGTGVEPEAPQSDEGDEADEVKETTVLEPVPMFLGGSRNRRRNPDRRRATTIAAKKILRRDLNADGADLAPELAQLDDLRPKTRGECRDAPRPCPWVACKHHLYLDINPETGSIKINFPDLEAHELAETCAIDVAERGALTLEEIGAITNLTRERIRQLEVRGLIKLKQTPEVSAIGPVPFVAERGGEG